MDSILKWLISHGYEYTWNFKLGVRTPDLIAFNDDEVLAFEFAKDVRDLSSAIKSCLSHQGKVNSVYIVLPIKAIKELKAIPNSPLEIIKRQGIGLIGINEKIKLFVEARKKDTDVKNPDMKNLLEKLKEKSFANIAVAMPNGNNGMEIKKKILEILAENHDGLSISSIAKKARFHRHTVAKYVKELMKSEKIYQRDLGNVKLHYLTHKFVEAEKNKLILEKLQRKLVKR